MSRSTSSNELIPSARRMVTSLRDLGYDFSAAVADVVDNSIESGATNVNIMVEFDGADSWVCIADNGSGMPLSTLTNAMRYGSMRDYEEDALAKFGLGLKTVSLSQCQRLTVSSRNQSGRLGVHCWDLEHIRTTDRWKVLSLAGKELPLAKWSDRKMLISLGWAD